jgi:hypothetical protein
MASRKRITPCISTIYTRLQFAREDAERDGNPIREVVCYSILWFLQTGRAFTGFGRALSHMTAGTIQALIRRVEREMLNARGTGTVVTGDLSNQALARALGFTDVASATEATCNHEFGTRYTLSPRKNVK